MQFSDPISRLAGILARLMDLRGSSREIIVLLAREGSMTVSQMVERLEVSRRTLYANLKFLLEKGLVRRRVQEAGRRLAYVYSLAPPEDLISKALSAVESLVGEISAIEKELEGVTW